MHVLAIINTASCLENSRDRGAWQATVPGVAESEPLKKQKMTTGEYVSFQIVVFSGCVPPGVGLLGQSPYLKFFKEHPYCSP